MVTTIDTLESRYIALGHTATGPDDYDDLIADQETALQLTRSQLADLDPKIIDAELDEREADGLYRGVLERRAKINAELITSQGNESKYAKATAEEDAVDEAFILVERELRSAKVKLNALLRQRSNLRQQESMLSMRLG